MRVFVLKCRLDFGQNLVQTRKKLMFSTWVQNHSSDKSYADSQFLFDILRLFLDFPRTFSEFVGRKQNYVGRFQNRVGRKINSVGHNPKKVP